MVLGGTRNGFSFAAVSIICVLASRLVLADPPGVNDPYNPRHASPELGQMLTAVITGVRAQQHLEVTPEHILAFMLRERHGGTAIMGAVNTPIQRVLVPISSYIQNLTKRSDGAVPDMSSDYDRVMAAAQRLAFHTFRDTLVRPEHVFLAMAEDSDLCGQTLRTAGVRGEAIRTAIRTAPVPAVGREAAPQTGSELLDLYSTDYTARALNGDLRRAIGRIGEVRQVLITMGRDGKNLAVLVGQPGVGKTQIAEEIAILSTQDGAPEIIRGKRIRFLDLGALVAGAKFRGEAEERLKLVLKEVHAQRATTVLFIDELHLVMGGGQAEGAMDFANLLKPALARGEILAFGATTLDEYRKYIEKDGAMERRCQLVRVEPPGVDETIRILRSVKEHKAKKYGIAISDTALVDIVTMTTRYVPNRTHPDKDFDVLDQTLARMKHERQTMPAALEDALELIRGLEIDERSLADDSNAISQERLRQTRERLRTARASSEAMRARWQEGRDLDTEIAAQRTRLGELNQALAAEVQRLARLADGERDFTESRRIQTDIDALGLRLTRNTTRMTELQRAGSVASITMTEVHVAQTIHDLHGIALSRLLSDDLEALTELERELRRHIAGQDEAIQAVMTRVRRARAGFKDPRRPIGTFIFIGPSSTGKSRLAQVLARALFGSEDKLIEENMTKYQEKHSVARLIGSPPGYVGSDDEGILASKLRRTGPQAVILLDEITVAHNDVWNYFLDVFRNGRSEDKGKVIDFRETIIIGTTSIGQEFYRDPSLVPAGRTADEMAMEALEKYFGKDDLLNRVHEIVPFRPLSLEKMREIVDIHIRRLNTEDLAGRRITLVVSPEARTMLAQQSMGRGNVAELEKVLDRLVMNQITDLAIARTIADGDTVLLHVEGEGETAKLKVKKAEGGEACPDVVGGFAPAVLPVVPR